MSVGLIYHENTDLGSISPFDEAIVKMIEGKEACIVCPYLGLNYLKRLINKTISWRLLTDVEEWLLSHRGESRSQIEKYIGANIKHIHHYRSLHAKVIITDNSALVGSANFTESGITERTEMSVLFENTEQVKELQNWFDKLWRQTDSVNSDELEKYVSSITDMGILASSNYSSLSCKAPRIKSRFLTEEHQIDQPRGSNSLWGKAILECIEMHGGEASLQQIYKAIPSFLALEEKHWKVDGRWGNRPNYHNEVRGYIKPLSRRGYLVRTDVGKYAITGEGRRWLRR